MPLPTSAANDERRDIALSIRKSDVLGMKDLTLCIKMRSAKTNRLLRKRLVALLFFLKFGELLGSEGPLVEIHCCV
jgi:hypothetical protein